MASFLLIVGIAVLIPLLAWRTSRPWLTAAGAVVGNPLDLLGRSLGDVARRAAGWWHTTFPPILPGRLLSDLMLSLGAACLAWADLRLQQATWQAPAFGLPMDVGLRTGTALTLAHVVLGAVVVELYRQEPIIRVLEGTEPGMRRAVRGLAVLMFLTGILLAGATSGLRAILAAQMTEAGGAGLTVMVWLTAAMSVLLGVLVATTAGLAAGVLPHLLADAAAVISALVVMALEILAWCAQLCASVWARVWAVPLAAVGVIQESAQRAWMLLAALWGMVERAGCALISILARGRRRAGGESGLLPACLPQGPAAGKEAHCEQGADEDTSGRRAAIA